MTEPEWRLVYDLSQRPDRTYLFVVAAVAVCALALLTGLFAYESLRSARLRLPRRHMAVLAAGGAIFAGLAIVAGALTWDWYDAQHQPSAVAALVDHSPVVEGAVEHFHPMPYTGHDLERFDVAGVHFEYSEYDLEETQGFNHTSSHGGPIHEGLYVRIHYVEWRGRPTIVRLEVRD